MSVMCLVCVLFHGSLYIPFHEMFFLSCVHRDCHGWSSIIAIHKEISSFQFQFNLTSNGIKVENMSKSKCMQKVVRSTSKLFFTSSSHRLAA